MRGAMILAATEMILTAGATPVAVDWKATETAPVKVARPFAGFLADGSFLVAGGSDFEGTNKVYRRDVVVRSADGKWTNVGELPRPVAEGVSCETPKGIFCAGGTDGQAKFSDAFLLTVENGASRIQALPPMPEPGAMGAAAADGDKVYVVASTHVFVADLSKTGSDFMWRALPLPRLTPREQQVAAIQNGDQKEKVLVIYGGYAKGDGIDKMPLRDGWALVLSKVHMDRDDKENPWRQLANLPENTTTIGAAFLPSGHQHILLIGGFGEKGWIDRAMKGSKESDPVKLGW